MHTHEQLRMFERWTYENIDVATSITQSRNNSDDKNQLHSPQRLNLKRQRLPEYDDDNISEYEEPKKITVTHLGRSHPNGWSSERHYGICSQSCPCCRAHVDGNTIGACSICLLTLQTNGRLTEPYASSSSNIRRTRSVSAAMHLGIQNSRLQP